MNKPSIPKGTRDFSPIEMAKRNYIFDTIKEVFALYGFQQIETPAMETLQTLMGKYGEEGDKLLFKVLNSGDFMSKVTDQDLVERNSLHLASVLCEKGLHYDLTVPFARYVVMHREELQLPFKRYQIQPVWRADRPQKGRYRQFHQVGVEIFGIPNPEIDAELIALTARLWKDLGIFDHVTLQLNSIGSLEARKNYRQALVDFLQNHIDILDEDSKRRLTTNPLRILDSKDQRVQEVLNDAPKLHDYLDDDSREHFAQLCALLDSLGIQYEINQKLVRGLDYYNKTVFEWVTSALGAQGTVCGGGRYDGLVEQLGGHATSGVGFAMGLERLVLLVQEVNTQITLPSAVDIYIVYQGEGTTVAAFNLAEKLRSELPHLRTLLHCSGGNFKKQFKRADKSGAKLALVIGEDEVKNQQVVVKNLLQHSEQAVVALGDIINHIQNTFK